MSSQPRHAALPGPHRRTTTVRALLGLTTVAVVAGTALTTSGLLAGQPTAEHPPTPACAPTDPPLVITAAPEIAPIIADVVRIGVGKLAVADGCKPPQVTARDPAQILEAIRSEHGDRPDVWVPDTSIWTTLSMPAGRSLPQGNPVVARSPLVLAVPRTAAPRTEHGALTVANLVPAHADLADPIRWGLPDAQRSAATVGAVLALKKVTAGHREGPTILANVLRGSRSDLPDGAEAQLDTAVAARLAVPVTEQAVWTYNTKHTSASGVVAAWPPQPGYDFDYPYVVLAAQQTRRLQAAAVLADLHGELGRRLLAAAGFRDVRGVAGTALSAQATGAPAETLLGTVPDAATVKTAVRALSIVRQGSRVLAVIDVSGSMATPIPGRPGTTRLDLALQAAVTGLAQYPDNSQIGLWTFSTHLTRTTDYVVAAPIGSLGPDSKGASGRMRLAQALAKVRVKPHGATGLYDTALAAVREVRRNWDPTRANSVVIITDGANEDDAGISLAQAVQTLRRENDPGRPVALFAIAYGPSSDVAALSAISKATGGRTYSAHEPRTIGAVLMDAIGRRACTKAC